MATASSFVKKIEDNFLACAICFEQLRDPIGLPCLHGFCFECLDNWYRTSQNKSEVICPACREPAIVSKGGIRAFPGHFIVKNLRETIAMEKQKPLAVGDTVRVKSTVSKPTYNWGTGVSHKSVGLLKSISGETCFIDFPDHRANNYWQGKLKEMELVKSTILCDICCQNATTIHCLDCSDNLCDDCLKSHNAFKFMKDHKIATVEDIESGKVTREGRYCKIHGELLRYYCETEEKQVCPDCVSLKTCPMEHERVSMKEAAKKQTASIDGLIGKCRATNVKIQAAVSDAKLAKQNLAKAKSEAEGVLEQVKKDCNRQIDALIQVHKKKINQLVEERGKKMQATMDKLEKNSTAIQTACEKGSELTKSGSEFEITHKYASMMKSLQELSQTQSEVSVPQEGFSYFKFEAVVPAIISIGRLHTPGAYSTGKEIGTLTLNPPSYNVGQNGWHAL